MKHYRHTIKKVNGFTIVELLIVIVVIGILAAITVVAYTGISRQAEAASLKSDLKQASTKLELEKVQSGEYPEDTGDLAKNPSTNYQYTKTGSDRYCLSATTATQGFYITNTNQSPIDGVCEGHILGIPPLIANAACFDFDSGTGTIIRYYDNENDNTSNPTCSKQLTIPSSISGVAVTTIGTAAFNGTHLTKVVIPNSVVTINEAAFVNNQISSLALGSSVVSIGQQAFLNSELTYLSIPSYVKIIGARAFDGNNLTSINIPDTVTSLGNSAFANNQIRTAVMGNGLISIDFGVLSSNPLESLTIGTAGYTGPAVTVIPDSRFNGYNMTSLTLGNSVISIGQAAFAYTKFTSLIIPNSVNSIGVAAFYSGQLTSVTIGNSITTIPDSAFSNNKITSITIPSSVTSIGTQAFKNNNFTSVTISSSATVASDAFDDDVVINYY